MAVFPSTQHGRRGGGGGGSARGAASSSTARKTTPRKSMQKGASGRSSSPRLQLTQKRTQSYARRGAGVGARTVSARQQTSRARGAASGTGAYRSGNAGSRSGGGGGARTAAKKEVQADGVAETVIGLKGELSTAAERAMERLEAGCGAFVAAALESCSSAASGREEENKMAEATLRDMESREASVTLPCSAMLKAIENNQASLSAMVKRCKATLDSLQQAESRKLKSSLDRTMGVKS